MADLPDSLTDTHNHPGLFQLVQGTLAGLGASGECGRYLHDGKADKQNPVAVRDSPGRKEGAGRAGFLSGCVHRPDVYAASNPV